MTLKNYLATRHIDQISIIKRMSLGALAGLIIISFFVFSVHHPDPNWGKLWRIRPLIVGPLAGALGSLVFYSKQLLNTQSNWKNALIILFSSIAFVIAIWMGIVLGLVGTLWN